MMKKKKVKNVLEAVDTVIGQEVVFEGNIKTDKAIRIDGKVVGDIEARGVLIGAQAEITGVIKCDVLITSGTIRGDIYALDSVELLEQSKVYGDISTNILSICEGACFEGRSSMIAQEVNMGDENNDEFI